MNDKPVPTRKLSQKYLVNVCFPFPLPTMEQHRRDDDYDLRVVTQRSVRSDLVCPFGQVDMSLRRALG